MKLNRYCFAANPNSSHKTSPRMSVHTSKAMTLMDFCINALEKVILLAQVTPRML